MAFRSHGVGDLGRTDVGRKLEDFRHRKHSALAVEVLDGETADADRITRIESIAETDAARIETHGNREGLEGGTHFERAVRHAVEPAFLGTFGRVVRVVIRHGGHGEHFAGMHIQNHRAGANRLELGDGRGHDFTDNGLHAQIDG
ncbi:hypothetical protein D3C71_1277510 [compost metagenome]